MIFQKRSTHCKALILIFLIFAAYLSAAACVSVNRESSVMAQVQGSGKLVIGVGTTVPPLNYIDANGNWVGFDLDLADSLTDQLQRMLDVDLESERIPVNNKTRISLLQTGRLHLTISSMSQTLSREEAIDFVEPPYLVSSKVFLVRKDEFEELSGLGGKRIAVVQGSNAFTAAPDELLRHTDSLPQMVSLQTNAECLFALKTRKVEAYSQDLPIIAELISGNEEDFEILGPGYSPSLYSIGVQENQSDWRDIVSLALNELLVSGQYDIIYDKWFGRNGTIPIEQDLRPRLPADMFKKQLYIRPR